MNAKTRTPTREASNFCILFFFSKIEPIIKKEKKDGEKVRKKVDRVEKKENKEKADRPKKDRPKEEAWEPSLSDKLGTIAPLLMATGGAIAYTRFPIVQSFVNSAVAQLMESLTSPEGSEKSSAPRGCARAPLPPAS